LLIIALATSPKWAPSLLPKQVQLNSAELLIRDKELTYIEAPADRQRVEKKPDTDKISDKDRIATKRPTTVDRKTLDELRDNRRPGSPGQTGPKGPTPQPVVPPQAQMAQGGAPAAPQPPAPSQAPQTMARLESPPGAAPSNKSAFSTGMAPGESIQQAARAAAAGRVGGMTHVGGGGDYGSGLGVNSRRINSDMDILSDTMGVDFGPYLARIRHDIQINWENLMPEVARPPLYKQGKVMVQFAILKNGEVAGMRLVGPSGDVSLDRAAWGGIQGSNPFPPLPTEFRGSYLALRCSFYYNRDVD
jgi:TonB family protein